MADTPNHLPFHPAEFTPMEGTGPEIDMVSGIPRAPYQEEQRRDAALHNQAQAQMVLEDLQGPGRIILQHLLARCVQRVQELASSDKELRMLLGTVNAAVYPIPISDRFFREAVLLLCRELLQVAAPLPPGGFDDGGFDEPDFAKKQAP